MKTNKTFPSDLGVSIIGTVTEHLLVWEGENSALPEWTSGLDVEDEEEDQNQHSCNTRKDRFSPFSCILLLIELYFRDKRVHRHTYGVFLLCWPCGIVVSYDELFGSEGKMQV